MVLEAVVKRGWGDNYIFQRFASSFFSCTVRDPSCVLNLESGRFFTINNNSGAFKPARLVGVALVVVCLPAIVCGFWLDGGLYYRYRNNFSFARSTINHLESTII